MTFPRGPNGERLFGKPESKTLPPAAHKEAAVSMALTPSDGRIALTEAETDEFTLSGRRMVFDRAAIESVVSGQTARILAPLPNGQPILLRIHTIKSRSETTHTLEGEVEGEDQKSVVQFVLHDGILHGSVSRYDIDQHLEYRILESGYMMVRELDNDAMTDECTAPDMDDGFVDGDTESNVSSGAGDPQPDTPGYVTVDLVSGYGMSARIADGGYSQIEARIIASVDRMNLAFSNSLITQTEVMLLGTIEDPDYVYPGEVSGSMGGSDELGDLSDTSSSNPNLNAVSDFANLLGADLKTFTLQGADGSAGVAYRPGTSAIVARTYMTSSRITFAHELGHNFGSRHSWGDSTTGDTATNVDNYGWRLAPAGQTRVRTIMAYDWSWGSGTRIPYYANPTVTYQGARTGQANGYNATGDSLSDARYVSGGLVGSLGAGFDGSNSSLGARNGPYILSQANGRANQKVRTSFGVITPAASTTWTKGTTETIMWTGGDYSDLASIDLYKGGVFQTNIASNVSGFERVQTWMVPSYLPPATDYRIRVTLNGTSTANSGFFTIVSDQSPPSRPDLTSASDTGKSNTDNKTADTTPTFSGTAAPGATLTLNSNLAGIIGSGTANSLGNWTITSFALNDGLHSIFASDSAVGQSPTLNVTIDTTPPSAPSSPDLVTGSDSGVSNTDNLTNDSTPGFSISSETGSTIELLANGAVTGTTTSTGYNVVTSSALPDGVRSITARSIDVAGNVGSESSALNITIDTVAPPFPTAMRVTAATDTGLSNVDNITANTSPSISGVSDADTEVTLFVDGIVAGTHPTGGSWTLPLSSLSNGIHQVTTQVEDAAGNLSIVSPFPLTVTIDTIPPAAPTNLRLTAATDTGVSNSDNLTRLSNVTLTGNAESGARISLLRNGTAVGSGNSSGTFNIGATGLPEGTTNFSAQQTDLAGNVGPVSGVAQVQVDLTPPAPSTTPLLSPASDSGASNSDGITRFQNLVFSGSSEAGGRITLLADGTSVGTALSDGSWSLTSLAISEGSHSITARAEDRAGNTAAESPATAVTLIFSAAPPTNVSLDPSSDLGFSNTDGVTSDRTPTITGNSGATDTIELSIGDPPYETSLGSGPGGPGWMVTSSLLPAGDGIKIIKARTLDIAGNLSSAVTTQFEIRTSSPGTPIGLSLKSGSDSGTSATDKITNINTPTIRGLVNLGGQSSLRINLEANGQPVGQATVNSGIWEFPTNVLPDGVLQIRALSEDFAGNLSAPSAPLTVTIDTTAPLAPASLQVAPADDTGVSNADNITRITQPEIIGIAEPGPVVLFINGTQQPGTLTSDGAWSYVPPSALPEG
ncbi:MAG: hypothetical protein KDN20_18155, partial [Verrucomicrobiae bacterium]|nr:hypothetical protein [Verrucomicrobiae bacterium]